jgi:hypothetical protein
MGDEKKALGKIEKALDRIAKQQDELCARIGTIEAKIDGLGAGADAADDSLLVFLDRFRAGEALGETSIGAWIEVCQDPCLRGGLRTVQTREGSHARLLEQRIKELGSSPSFEIPEAIFDASMTAVGTTDKTDAEKLLGFVQQFPDVDAAIQPILDQADKCGDDIETASLLRTIAVDERATLEFLGEACALLNP